MPFSLHDAAAGTFSRMLTNLDAILAKAEANAAARGFKPDNFVGLRLAPDMLPFSFQIQSATDRAKLYLARVTEQDAPSWADDETTFAELRARVQKGIAYVGSYAPGQLDGLEDKRVKLKRSGQEVEMTALDYLMKNAYPNFYFHVTTAYALLRQAGVPIGKRDFVG
jgi:hypothetical protein